MTAHEAPAVDPTGGSRIDRRRALAMGAAAGAGAWVAPAVLSLDAAAASSDNPNCPFSGVQFRPETIQALPITPDPPGTSVYDVGPLGASGWTVVNGEVTNTNRLVYGGFCDPNPPQPPLPLGPALLMLASTGQPAVVSNFVQSGNIVLVCDGRYRIRMSVLGHPLLPAFQEAFFGATGDVSVTGAVSVAECELKTGTQDFTASAGDTIQLVMDYVTEPPPLGTDTYGPLVNWVRLDYLGP